MTSFLSATVTATENVIIFNLTGVKNPGSQQPSSAFGVKMVDAGGYMVNSFGGTSAKVTMITPQTIITKALSNTILIPITNTEYTIEFTPV
jgi:hypothetical protein